MKKTTTALTLGTLLLAGSSNALAAGYEPEVKQIEGGGYIIPLLGPKGTDASVHTPQELDSLRPTNCRTGKKSGRCRKFQAYALGLNYFMREGISQQEEMVEGLKNFLTESQSSLAAARAEVVASAKELALKKSIMARIVAGCEGFRRKLPGIIEKEGEFLVPSDYSYIVSTYDNLVGSGYADAGEYAGGADVICALERDFVIKESSNSLHQKRRMRVMYTLKRKTRATSGMIGGVMQSITMHTKKTPVVALYEAHNISVSEILGPTVQLMPYEEERHVKGKF